MALYYGAWHQAPRLRERWLSHPSLFVEVSVPRQLMGSGPGAGGGCLDKSLPTSHQKAAISSKLNVSCWNFYKDHNPFVYCNLGTEYFPALFNICIVTVYYKNLTLCIVSMIPVKLFLSIVFFISPYHCLAWSTTVEVCFHGEGWGGGGGKVKLWCNVILKMSPSWAL